MSITQNLWEHGKIVYQNILELPFLKKLAQGDLAREAFIFYLEQDALYLIEFAKAFNQIASRMHAAEDVNQMMNFAQGALIAERSVHEHYFQMFQTKPQQEMMPSCLAYSNFLRLHATQSPIDEALAALLPCFWIYAEVGLFISKNAVIENNPYHDWIATYGGEEFQTVVKEMIAITERFAQNESRMKQAYLTSCRYEWLFWDAAYRLEKWLPC